MRTILSDEAKCTGCRACEVICAFHHTRTFSRANTSIRVSRIEGTGEFKVRMLAERGAPCDLCAGENAPMCVTFCASGALSVEDDGA